MRSVEKRLAEELLEFANLMADGRRCQVQLMSGQREALQARGGFKRTQQDEVGDSSHASFQVSGLIVNDVGIHVNVIQPNMNIYRLSFTHDGCNMGNPGTETVWCQIPINVGKRIPHVCSARPPSREAPSPLQVARWPRVHLPTYPTGP